MSRRGAARVASAQKRQTESTVQATVDKFGYATAVAGSDATKVVIVWEGLPVTVPKFQVYAQWMPGAGERVFVHENDGQVNIVGVSRGT
jgi:hypothetical protein